MGGGGEAKNYEAIELQPHDSLRHILALPLRGPGLLAGRETRKALSSHNVWCKIETIVHIVHWHSQEVHHPKWVFSIF